MKSIPYSSEYRDAVVQLCLENTGCLSASEETQLFTTLTKCDYYLEHTPETCFLALDDDGTLAGCLLGCPDMDDYEVVFTEEYLPKAAALSVRRYVDAKLGLLPYAMFRQDYKAHFSLYIKSTWGGMGVEDLLVTAALAALRERHVSGVATVFDADNEDLINVLKQKGFKDQLTTKFGHAMTLSFKETAV